jgi:hypothetical protein
VKRPGSEYCMLCGQPAAAAYGGDHTIAVCGECALEALPVLIADAVEIPSERPWGRLNRALDTVERRFWRAISCRLLRERRERQ